MKIKSSVVWALGMLALAAVLAAVYPPKIKYPFLQIEQTTQSLETGRAEGFAQLTVLLAPAPSTVECDNRISRVQAAILAVSPSFQVADTHCLQALGALSRLAANEPIQEYSIRFRGGDILIRATSVNQAEMICAEIERLGAGVCYPPGAQRAAANSVSKTESFLLSSGPGQALTFTGSLFSSALAFALALIFSVFIVATQRWHGRFTFDQHHGVQKFHSAAVPRIGGLAIFLGLVFTQAISLLLPNAIASDLMLPVLLAAIPAVAFGLAEDLTKRVGVRERLLATMTSAVLGWWLTGITLNHLDIPGIDRMLIYLPVSIAFTAIAVGGLANAINIIDGFHGLASGVVAITLSAIGIVALQVGDDQLAILCFIFAAAVTGFFMMNFPFGKLFLGDGGAYLLGFILGWMAVLLPMRNPDVSPWASLLICGYPVTETIFSIIRRLRAKLDIGQPDREHLHSLIKLEIIRPLFVGHFSDNIRNAMVAPLLWVFAAIPAIAVFFYYNNTAILAAWFFGYCLLYGLIYWPLKTKAGHFPRQH